MKVTRLQIIVNQNFQEMTKKLTKTRNDENEKFNAMHVQIKLPIWNKEWHGGQR